MQITNKEIQEYKLKKRSKEELYFALKPLISWQKKVFLPYVSSGYFDEGDIESLIWLGIERAIETFKDDGKSTFSTWAIYCIKQTILKEFKKIPKRNISIHIFPEGIDAPMEEVIPDPTSEENFSKVEETFQLKSLRSAIKKLPEDQKKIISHYFVDNLSLSDISKKMNISPTETRTLKFKALRNLKNYL